MTGLLINYIYSSTHNKYKVMMDDIALDLVL